MSLCASDPNHDHPNTNLTPHIMQEVAELQLALQQSSSALRASQAQLQVGAHGAGMSSAQSVHVVGGLAAATVT